MFLHINFSLIPVACNAIMNERLRIWKNLVLILNNYTIHSFKESEEND
jgi:hypothetical protein